MKINKEELAKLTKKSDAELWSEITRIAKSHGYTLPEKTPSHSELERLRSTMLGLEKINLSDATRIINSYKNKKQ